jgi:BirA family biotin operon repressor/biotin-[acetyl-CoA-carboxylase] ligase
MTDPAPTPLIDLDRLIARLGPLAAHLSLTALPICDSSNAMLLARAAAGAAGGSVVVCDRQTTGRGRRGRSWLSEPRASLTFSLLWRFPPRAQLSGLSLAIGVAINRALATCGVPQARLKWPNDILLPVDGGWGKVGGVLIELAADAAGVAAVIGVGINLEVPVGLEGLDFPAAGLADVALTPERHQLLAALLREMVAALDGFADSGFAPFADAWSVQNAFADQPVSLRLDKGQTRDGICRGVDADGALRLETASGCERVLAGDVSLRPRPGP